MRPIALFGACDFLLFAGDATLIVISERRRLTLALEPAQRPQFVALDRVRGRGGVLDSADVYRSRSVALTARHAQRRHFGLDDQRETGVPVAGTLMCCRVPLRPSMMVMIRSSGLAWSVSALISLACS
jgi:hypothetical protein